MELKSILNKIVEAGRLILTQPTMLFIDKEEIGIIKEHTVTEDEQGRIDIICLDFYNTDEHMDYLLKFNGISDPFSIKKGDILKIPVIGNNFKVLQRPEVAIDNIVRQEFVAGKRMTPKDQKRIEFLKKKHKLKEVLPPNVLKTGYKTFKFTERDGEKATEFGMGAMLPDPVKAKKDKIKVAKDLDVVKSKDFKKVDPAIFDKDMKELTLKEVEILKNAGIPLDKFEEAKAAKLADNESATSKPKVEEMFDDKGNMIGKTSIRKSVVFDAGKKATTTTKTTVKYDGTIETSQQTTFSLAGDISNTLDIDKLKKKNKDTENTEKGLDEKLKNKKILKKKDILKKKETDRKSKRNKKR
jgi:hypothetical protein